MQKKIDELKSKVTKLAQSLSAISNEKCQMEAQFQLERKQLYEKNSQVCIVQLY